MTRLLHGLALASLLLLAACATAPGPPAATSADWEALRAALAAETHWSARGKIALRNAGQAESASLDWRQSGRVTRLDLSGPLGFSATTIESDGDHLSIRRGDDFQRWALDDPELRARNQWQLPLSSLHYWLKGIPAPGAAVDTLEFDPGTNMPSLLRQQGWTVQYGQFELFGGRRLPTRIEVTRDTTRARIILREWDFGTS